MWFKALLSIVLFLNLAGCATSRKEMASLQVQQLMMRISELETELQQKDEEISYLGGQLERIRGEKTFSAKKKEIKESKSGASKATTRNIQIALKDAGLYSGPIDGKIGKGTKKAIKEFQKGNGLTADGIVGKETWLKLKKYLD